MKAHIAATRSVDSEALGSRQLSNEYVARLYDCPPTSAGIIDKATYSSNEQEGHVPVTGTMGLRFVTATMRDLPTEVGRRALGSELDLSSLLSGDFGRNGG